jgi:dTDP-4-amino-4,6-dideoxygalactose transaminase
VKEAKLSLWPPMMSTRERLKLSEASAGFRHPDILQSLGVHLPLADRSWALTTYGKGAFELAVRDAGLAGTKMIVPAFISHDFVGVFYKYNITPLFVDVDPATYQLTPEACVGEMLDSTAALILLHTFGLPAEAGAFRTLCDRHGLVMIEDCARALGGICNGKLVGYYGDYSAFSLSKVAPVRRGGLLLSRRPVDVSLPEARAGVSGILNQLVLLKWPGLEFLEGPLYRLLRETPVYPGEIGLYDPPEVEQPERIVQSCITAFFPHYADALRVKRQVALAIRSRLEPLGFEFQADPGNHIYTALGALVPQSVNKQDLHSHLQRKAINSYTLWEDPLGTSSVARDAWGTDGSLYPVTAKLATRLIHFPIGRFIADGQVDRLVEACRAYMASGRT